MVSHAHVHGILVAGAHSHQMSESNGAPDVPASRHSCDTAAATIAIQFVLENRHRSRGQGNHWRCIVCDAIYKIVDHHHGAWCQGAFTSFVRILRIVVRIFSHGRRGDTVLVENKCDTKRRRFLSGTQNTRLRKFAMNFVFDSQHHQLNIDSLSNRLTPVPITMTIRQTKHCRLIRHDRLRWIK